MTTRVPDERGPEINPWAAVYAIAAAVVGVVVLSGWIADVPLLKSILPGALPVKTNTGIALLLSAVAILVNIRRSTQAFQTIATLCGISVVIIGGTTLLEYLFNWVPGIDELVFREGPGALLTASPNRMAVTTALGMLFLGFAIVFRAENRLALLVDICLLSPMFIALFGMLASIYGAEVSGGSMQTSQIAPVTAFTIVLLSVALALSRSTTGIMRFVTSTTSAGMASRVLLPAVFIIPIAAAWLHRLGGMIGVYQENYGVVLFAFLNSAMFVLLILFGTRYLVESGETLRERERRFVALIEHGADAIALLDPSGMVLFTTASSQKIGGYTPGEFVGRNVLEIIHPNDRNAIRQSLMEVMELPDKSVAVSARFLHKSGSWRWIEATGSNKLHEESIKAIVVNYRDVTANHEADRALVESQKLQRQVLDNIDDVIMRVKFGNPITVGGVTTFDNERTFLNESIEQRLGYSTQELSADNTLWSSLIHPEDVAIVRDASRYVVQEKRGITHMFRMQTRQGSYRWVEDHVNPEMNDAGNVVGLFIVSRDVTDRVNAEEYSRKVESALHQTKSTLEALIRTSPMAIFSINAERHLTFWNPAAELIFGWSESEVIGRNNPSVPAEYEDESRILFMRILEGDTATGYETKRITSSGELIDVSISTAPMRDEHGVITGIMALVENISARKLAEQTMRIALQQKELLLKEIHHRVKNNLQVISSLLNMQSARLVDDRDRMMFFESQNRIRSIALVHELLYRSPDLTRIDFEIYMRTLGDAVFGNVHLMGNEVNLKYELQTLMLDIDTAIPCGLIVNELVTNALKHAFPGGRQGTVTISAAPIQNNGFRIRVEDDGIGIDPLLNVKEATTLGLQLVTALCDQIDCTLRVERMPGTSFTIERFVQ